MKVRGLNNVLFITAEHFPNNFNIFGQTVDGSPAIINFVYIIEKFKPKMLIGNDILNPEIIIPDIGKSNLTIENCKNMTAKLNVRNIGKRMVRFNGVIKIPAKSTSVIPFKLRGKNGALPLGRDFMFILKRIDQLGNDGGVCLFSYSGCIYGHGTNHKHQYRKRLFIWKQQIKYRSKLWNKVVI